MGQDVKAHSLDEKSHDTLKPRLLKLATIFDFKKPQNDNSHPQKDPNNIMHPWKRWDIIASTVCLNIFALIIPIVILQLYDRIIPNQATRTLSILALGVGIAILLESILRIARSYVLGWISQQFDYSTSSSVFSHLVHSNLYGLNKMGVGEHIENIESLNTLKEFLAGQSLLIFLDLPFLLLFLGLIDYFGGRPIVVITVVVLVLFVVSSLYLGRKLHRNLMEQQNVGDRKYSFLVQMLNNYYTIKALGMEELILRRFERIQLQTSFSDYKINVYSTEARYMGALFSSILFGAIVYIAGSQVIHTVISPGAMAACLFLSNRVIQPLQQGLSVWTRFQHFKIAKKRFEAIQSLPIEENEGVHVNLSGNIALKNISFGYDGSKNTLYKNINIAIREGQFITIIGKGGAGKTTLAQLIMGNLMPLTGNIILDNIPLSQMNMPHYRRQIAYLSSQGDIFHGSVMDNLTMFSHNDNEREIKILSRKVGLDRWIKKLPQGYDTLIGNHLDGELPLGIQQRLCFVRALLLSPKILILDEANTHMDLEGDQELIHILRELRGKMTILFITHRPSIVRFSDRIFEIRDQKLIERGVI